MSLVVSILAALLSSSDSDPLIYTMIGAGLGVYLFVRGFRALQRKRLIMDTPTAKVRSAAIGLVEMQGTAIGPFTFIAPITRAPCYYHRTQLWRWVQRGKSSEWERVADECLHVPFYLKDSTGMVLVDPNGAEMELHCDYKKEFNHSLFGSASIPGPVMEFMNRYGVGTNHSIKVEEYCIKPDNALFILGTLATNSGLRPVPSPLSTLQGNFKLGHWTVGMKSAAGAEIAASLLGGNLAGLALSSLVSGGATTTTVTTTQRDGGAIKKTVSVTTTGGAPQAETLQPGDPRAAAAVEAIAAKDPALAAKVAAQLNVPYPPPAGAAAPSVSVTEIPGGVKITSRQVTNLAVPAPPGQTLMPAEAHQLAVAALAAKDPALAAVVATALGRAGAAAIIQPAAGSAAAAAPGGNGGATWPDHDPTVIMKGMHNPAYFISWQSQKDVIKELSRRSILLIWGGPALTVVCMLYILGRFGLL
jgi:hypothetical protein